MANFNTHFIGAAISSGVISSTLLTTGLYSPKQGIVLWCAGTIGGFLPDIDSDSSPVLRGIFTFMAMVATLLTLPVLAHWPLLPLWGCLVLVFLTIRVGLMWCFAKFTRHRGAFHSLLAAATISMGTVYGCWSILKLSLTYSWSIGAMVFLGYITHLILDECYSVNLSGFELKRSFGTALKLLSLRYWKASTLFLLLGLIFVEATPAPNHWHQVIDKLKERPLYKISVADDTTMSQW